MQEGMLLLNTGFTMVLLVLGWSIRREMGKLDQVIETQTALKLDIVQMRAERKAHEKEDDMRFHEYGRRLDHHDAQFNEYATWIASKT